MKVKAVGTSIVSSRGRSGQAIQTTLFRHANSGRSGTLTAGEATWGGFLFHFELFFGFRLALHPRNRLKQMTRSPFYHCPERCNTTSLIEGKTMLFRNIIAAPGICLSMALWLRGRPGGGTAQAERTWAAGIEAAPSSMPSTTLGRLPTQGRLCGHGLPNGNDAGGQAKPSAANRWTTGSRSSTAMRVRSSIWCSMKK